MKDSGASISEFLPLNEVIEKKKQLHKRLIKEAWPIASAEGGNYICLVVGQKAGIYYWDHESEVEENQLPNWDNMLFLAKNFSEFLDKIQPYGVDNINLKPGQVISTWSDPDFKPKF